MTTRAVVTPLAITVFVAAWEVVGRAGWVSPVLLSTPSRMVAAAPALIPLVVPDLWFTVRVFLASLVTAVLVGTVLGGAMGASRLVDAALGPFVVALNATPKVLLMPLVVLWFGIGVGANVFLGALMAAFPIILSTQAGVRALERDHLVVGRAFGASRTFLLRTIVLPGMLPHVVAGVRIGVNYAMVGVLLSELFASSRGIGHRMVVAMQNFEVDAFFVCLVIVAGFTALASWLVQRLEAHLLRFRPREQAEAATP